MSSQMGSSLVDNSSPVVGIVTCIILDWLKIGSKLHGLSWFIIIFRISQATLGHRNPIFRSHSRGALRARRFEGSQSDHKGHLEIKRLHVFLCDTYRTYIPLLNVTW
jgi:hypothetical protein